MDTLLTAVANCSQVYTVRGNVFNFWFSQQCQLCIGGHCLHSGFSENGFS